MSETSGNIVWHPSSVTREDRQRMNHHGSAAIWFTGLSGAGKSIISTTLEKELIGRNVRSYVLDGDNLRHGLNSNLGFSPKDRRENIRRIGEVSKLFVDAGIFALSACISPYREDRNFVRSLFASGEFIEVYVKCSLEECERRDPKGMYRKARAGEIQGFTGISAPYEEPEHPEITIESDQVAVAEAVEIVLAYMKHRNFI